MRWRPSGVGRSCPLDHGKQLLFGLIGLQVPQHVPDMLLSRSLRVMNLPMVTQVIRPLDPPPLRPILSGLQLSDNDPSDTHPTSLPPVKPTP